MGGRDLAAKFSIPVPQDSKCNSPKFMQSGPRINGKNFRMSEYIKRDLLYTAVKFGCLSENKTLSSWDILLASKHVA